MLDPARIDPAKRIAALYLHPGCDMACTFCASERSFDRLDQAQAEALVADLAAAGFASVVLGGGEPLLWPGDLAGLARHAKGLGLLVQLCTNGQRLPDDLGALDAVDRFLLPLEGATPAVHDALRSAPGSHHAIVHTRIRELTQAGRELTFSTVVTRRNVGELEALAAELAVLHGRGARIHAWHLYRFLPVGRGGRPNGPRLAIEPRQFLRAARAAQQAGLAFPVYRRDDMLRSSTVEHLWLEGGVLRLGSEEHARRRDAG